MSKPTDDHEGRRLLAALERAGVTRRAFADAMKTSPQHVSKAINSARIGDGAWRTLRDGLVALHIDPGEVKMSATQTGPAVWSGARVPTNAGANSWRDTLALLDGIEGDVAQRVRQLLDAGDDAREMARVILEERTRRK